MLWSKIREVILHLLAVFFTIGSVINHINGNVLGAIYEVAWAILCYQFLLLEDKE